MDLMRSHWPGAGGTAEEAFVPWLGAAGCREESKSPLASMSHCCCVAGAKLVNLARKASTSVSRSLATRTMDSLDRPDGEIVAGAGLEVFTSEVAAGGTGTP